MVTDEEFTTPDPDSPGRWRCTLCPARRKHARWRVGTLRAALDHYLTEHTTTEETQK